MITSEQLRQKYLEFFKNEKHATVPSASLIPENDPTVLFTTAGMHPLVPYLLGEKHPAGKRLVSVQKCVRTGDIDEVGDNRHLTFFEMLGNWSLGDYFKKEAIEWSWEFLTSSEYLGLDAKKLAVSAFDGDKTAPRDEESAKIWKSLGLSENKIVYLPKENNWWGPAGQTGPCGPDTEIFYWRGENEFPSESSNPKDDEDNWLEIWNDVFMQYNKTADGKYEPLKQTNVDTGMGLERTLVSLNGFVDVFQTDTLKPLIEKIEEISGYSYAVDKNITRSMRIIADHLRTATMIMSDDHGVAPSNVDQGYVVRRLIRRAVRHGRLLGIKENFCDKIAERVIQMLSDVYPELIRNKAFVLNETAKEESKFRNTIEQGLKEFEKLLDGFRQAFEKTGMLIKQISGKQAFKLYDTYGFPLEMTQELAVENNLEVDAISFEDAFKKHQELSRVGAEQKFKGGLADTGEMSVKYHTTTHLLHAALKKVLGSHVEQRGSNITAERLRFDFSHPEKMSETQKEEVSNLVNYAIEHNYPVTFEETTVAEARKRGATGLFEDKYGNLIKVYSVGDPLSEPDAHINSLTFSKEICGGPHMDRTELLGKFRIIKEEAVSSGVRRIKAILE
ncbi:MAG: alanine--tRNA ligase [Candidatus Magasanikbacteria bacterium CG10_big_fil_rev_8_21_14_0_10_36_32]|uniref:Alanine--tRNA ligase n=1 Tax=Candidatus Magasanikbacteria bacterium CG10_big_fil_rev_8_21_14_0_10_36_32 TaxID=1974646 RepID=A0A2M6W7J6_9BACT|nr:MAG: alanine--tRNA ligase [Candidatus Magasanikbacteria bacterium CG10_big_fil_rev_8_21_14_0_10_36_32]